MAAAEEPGTEVIAWSTPAYRTGRALVSLFLRTWCPRRVEGREHVPAEGGVLIVSNHQSMLDIPLISASLRRHVCFVARDSLAKFAPLAWLMRRSGAVLVQRGRPDRQALREMVAHLAAGDAVAIYPEGTRTSDGSVGEFKAGFQVVARQAGVPVVPAGIRGTMDVLGRKHKLPRPGRVAIRYGAPLDPKDPELVAKAHAAVAELVGDGHFA